MFYSRSKSWSILPLVLMLYKSSTAERFHNLFTSKGGKFLGPSIIFSSRLEEHYLTLTKTIFLPRRILLYYWIKTSCYLPFQLDDTPEQFGRKTKRLSFEQSFLLLIVRFKTLDQKHFRQFSVLYKIPCCLTNLNDTSSKLLRIEILFKKSNLRLLEDYSERTFAEFSAVGCSRFRQIKKSRDLIRTNRCR